MTISPLASSPLVPSPLAPKMIVSPTPIMGVYFKVGHAGAYYDNRANILLARFDQPAPVAGVFTRSECASAPVDWCKNILGKGIANALVVNAGNANAFAGRKGVLAVDRLTGYVSDQFNIAQDTVYLASTGVIGEPLDPEPVLEALRKMVAREAADFNQAANAIRTTDTYEKLAGTSFDVDGQTYHISGIAKGSGMIAPDMATMLSFIFTDFQATAAQLNQALKVGVKDSFNAITVDGDTSTSDTVLLFGCAGVPAANASFKGLEIFQRALGRVMHDLALQIVKDGEGAQKLIKVRVKGAQSDESAQIIAKSVANSPLVKTAVAGEDANWGRVVMAVGKAGEPADRDKIAIWFGELRLAFEGARDPDYSEEKANAYMKNAHIDIVIDLALGTGEATIYTCDLTHGYIAINAAYRS